VSLAYLVLLGANVVYATSYVATRVTLGSVPPAALALARLVIGWLVLAPLAPRRASDAALSCGDRRAIAWMGILGFAGAFVLAHWGIARSTATNAALSTNSTTSTGHHESPRTQTGSVTTGVP